MGIPHSEKQFPKSGPNRARNVASPTRDTGLNISPCPHNFVNSGPKPGPTWLSSFGLPAWPRALRRALAAAEFTSATRGGPAGPPRGAASADRRRASPADRPVRPAGLASRASARARRRRPPENRKPILLRPLVSIPRGLARGIDTSPFAPPEPRSPQRRGGGRKGKDTGQARLATALRLENEPVATTRCRLRARMGEPVIARRLRYRQPPRYEELDFKEREAEPVAATRLTSGL